MNQKQIIESLRNEVKINPASSAVLHLFAMRMRTRDTITLNSLYNKMIKEGYKFKKTEYLSIINLMAKLGLGTLDVSSNGRIKGLIHIEYTLQSIGAIACGTSETPQKYKQKNKFVALMPKPDYLKSQLDYKVNMTLILSINGKPLEVKVPKDMTAEELASIIRSLNH